MNLPSLTRKPVLYIILSGFVILLFVQLSLLNSAFKGKEKDFNDKVFYLVWFYEQHFSKDTVLMNSMVTDSAAASIARGRIKKDIDSLFYKNSIPLDYVFAVGKSTGRKERTMTGNNLFWSSDAVHNQGLNATKLRIANIGPRGSEVYYVKIFFPAKPLYIFKNLLPLIIISALTLLTLFFCFLALMVIIKRQSRLAGIKNDFINNMTHELKTPLFTISIASKMLAEQEPIRLNDKYVSYVESIQQETKRLTELVEKVLQASALEKKQLGPEKKQMDMHEAITKAVNSLELIRQEQKARIHLSLQAGRHDVYAVETHMVSMIYSLVDNAFKYSDGPADITITTRNENDAILISVADKGIGFDMETKEMIFERFFRAHTGNLHKVKGYGIGLNYVKSIIEAHNGSISVNSAIGKGSEFILVIPIVNYGK